MAILGGLLLLFAWGLTWLAARAVLAQVGERRLGVVSGFAVALLYTLPNLLGPWLLDLRLAVLATAIVSALTVRALWRRGGPESPGSAAFSRPTQLGLLVLVALVTWASFGGYFWDEWNCHDPLVAVMARGLFPPEHPLFPGEPFRYHYGFDLLAAQVRACAGLPLGAAIDVVNVALFVVLLWVGRDVGESLGGRLGAQLGPFIIPLGTGFLEVLLFGDSGWMSLKESPFPASYGQAVPPPMLSNFFQHPQGVGMPVSLAVLLLFADRWEIGRPRRLVGAALLGMLALGQIVYFGLLGLALGAVSVERALRGRRWRELPIDLGLLLLALGLAKLSGGFFAPGPQLPSMMIYGQGLWSDPWFHVVGRLGVYFGLALLAVPAAIYWAFRRPAPLRTAALVAGLVGLVVPLSMTYRDSWDIVKFFSAFGFFANVLTIELLVALKSRRALLVICTILTLSTGVVWLLRMSVFDGRFGVPAMHFPPPALIGQQAAEALQPHLGPKDRVYSRRVELGLAGGLLTPGFDHQRLGQGFILDRPAHERLLAAAEQARRTLDPAALTTLGVRVLALWPEDLAQLTPNAKAALQDPNRFLPLAKVTAPDGRVEFYWIVGAPPAGR